MPLNPSNGANTVNACTNYIHDIDKDLSRFMELMQLDAKNSITPLLFKTHHTDADH